MPAEPRALVIGVRLTRTERRLLDRRAKRAGLKLSEYLRARALEPAPESREVRV